MKSLMKVFSKTARLYLIESHFTSCIVMNKFFPKVKSSSFFTSNSDNVNPPEDSDEANVFDHKKIFPVFGKTLPGIKNLQVKHNIERDTGKAEYCTLIHYPTVIVPYSRIIINRPSNKDPLIGLIIKNGKLTAIDEGTTVIDNVALTSLKDPTKGKKANSETALFNLGVLCRCTYFNKEKMIIEGLDTVYKIPNANLGLKSSSHKFFNPKETNSIGCFNKISANDDDLEAMLTSCKKIIGNISHISSSLKLDEEYFGDEKISFNFSFKDIRSVVKSSDRDQGILKEDMIKFSYYFLLKASSFSNLMSGSLSTSSSPSTSMSNDLTKQLLLIEDVKVRLDKISEMLQSFANVIKIKYECYSFPKLLHFEKENPFKYDTDEEIKRVNKYKEVIDRKISKTDTIEKQKDAYRRKINEISDDYMPTDVKKHLEKEINKISGVYLEQETTKRIEYLNHVICLPWDKFDKPRWDLSHAKNILDQNLYGLAETKERIYEFIAKNLRKNNQKGCVILLTGGPGTGKTRIAKLIGEALQRKVGYVSLAGMSDGKSILGFKRTYVGSTPGLFIKTMQTVGVKNPVIVVDEIDKVGFRMTHSNVYHALLQLLNMEENHRFHDHYLEIPFDFSNAVFILTSNNEDIFAPLMDRIEVIRVEPYVLYEKFLIAKNYALKQILEDYHVSNNFQITDAAMHKLIFDYCRKESGVRRAKKLLESVVRKVNMKLMFANEDMQVQAYPQVVQINSKNISKILNEPIDQDPVLTEMILNSNKRVGCCMGLFISKSDQSNSWGSASIFSISVKGVKRFNANGNNKTENKEIISPSEGDKTSLKIHNQIEKVSVIKKDTQKKKKRNNSHFRLSCSGNLGEDSLQSLDIALNVATQFIGKIAPDKADFFYMNQIHHDCPEILLPKSGPSAGLVIFLCAVSLALNKPLIPNLAMTGEISIDGSVLKVGGIKEKAQGAQQFNVKTLVLPIGNRSDFLDLPKNLKDSFSVVYFVDNVSQVYRIGMNLDTTGMNCYIPDKFLGSTEYEEILISSDNNIIDKLF